MGTQKNVKNDRLKGICSFTLKIILYLNLCAKMKSQVYLKKVNLCKAFFMNYVSSSAETLAIFNIL